MTERTVSVKNDNKCSIISLSITWEFCQEIIFNDKFRFKYGKVQILVKDINNLKWHIRRADYIRECLLIFVSESLVCLSGI
jgi:hypothetical protein